MSGGSGKRSGKEAERWKRIDRLLEQALERGEEERASFLEEACGGDANVRAEVEELLAAHEQAGGFLGSPALEVAARDLAAEKAGSLAGRQLGPYRIVSIIGAGGMGEVYRAQDTRLDRAVALKILPAEFSSDAERMRRFRREARAASALNHANLATIYDVGDSDGSHYIAMEYVEGKTLDQRIGRKGMRLQEALDCAVQIADALAAAHEAGIVHRDLKPGNVMVTEKGQVKVLDFGLAKLRERETFGGREATVATQPTTEEGRILGTVAYMSPEQAEGKKVDARSDIFSFGCVLYEMVTGRRAFGGESGISTLSAILHQEPKPASAIAASIPADLEKLINRCLRKDPDRRIQHMDDVKLLLAELKEDLDSGRLQLRPAAVKRASPQRIASVIVAVVVLIAAGWYWLIRQRPAKPEAPLTAVPLTSYPGTEGMPAFSPDGNSVAFQWCPEGRGGNCDIWIKQIGVEAPFRLTTDPAEDFSPAWSPDGNYIAFIRRLSPVKGALIIVPQRGGNERIVGETHPRAEVRHFDRYLTWTPDSKGLIFCSLQPVRARAGGGLFLLSLETLETRRLTAPLEETDSDPALSHDGRILAFTRRSAGRAGICLLRLGTSYEPQGTPARIVTQDDRYEFGPAWMPGGSEIVFCEGFRVAGGLWRREATQSALPFKLAFASGAISAPAVSRDGSRLVYQVGDYDSNIWRLDLADPGPKAGTPFKLIQSTRNEFLAAFSPDGRRVAFSSDRSGHYEIWVCDSDGSNPAQLTSFDGGDCVVPRWSPDGLSVLFAATAQGNEDVYVINAQGGAPRRLTTHPGDDKWPCWSRDGRSIYFKSTRGGGSGSEIWKMPVAGGEPVQITRDTGDVPQESPDGKFLYYLKGDSYPASCSVWRTPVEGDGETKVLDSVHCSGHYAVMQQGIWYIAIPDEEGHSEIRFRAFDTGETRAILKVEVEVRPQIAVSPDGRTILYTQLDQAGSDLMLVENFR